MKGCFQGDALSPIIFLIMFQPVISHIQIQQEKQGYDLNGTKVITTPFEGDFEIITRNKLEHQKLQDDIQEKLTFRHQIFSFPAPGH